MPMHEHREVAIGERRWLVRDRVQRETWTGEQFVAIGSGDLAVLVHALTVEARHRHARGGRADLVLRLEIDALRVQTAVIDPRADIEFSEALVRMIGPSLAPVVPPVGSVPFANPGDRKRAVSGRRV